MVDLNITSVVHQDAAVLSAPDLVASDDGVTARPDLHPGVHVVEDVVVFQGAVTVVVEIHPDLQGTKEITHMESC